MWSGLNKSVELGMSTPGATSSSSSGNMKQILFNVSGIAKPGEMIALMGPSGSGKTTLLNVLGGRALANLTGQVLINNVPFKKSMRRTIAYVLQEDIFYQNLTVRQQLYFTSHLRLPSEMDVEAKRQAVDNIIKILRMDRCADTMIMLISGGEKKRCNIGTELLTNPSILILDEPTSGLDSTAANALIVTLRELANDRMTVISSIHQPSSKVFYSFDKLFLLADGHIVYNGSTLKCMQYLARRKFLPPADYNPADFIMDLVTSTEVVVDNSGIKGDISDGVVVERTVRSILIDSWDNVEAEKEIAETIRSHQAIHSAEGDESSADFKYLASYSTQFKVLLERAMINSRSNLISVLTVSQAVGAALLCGIIWFRMPYSEDRVQDRAGFIFFFMTYWVFMSMFQGMMHFLPERHIIMKERSSGSYRLSAYYISKIISELPMRLLLPFIFVCISYPMANMNPSVGVFFAIAILQLLATLAGESVGLFIGTMFIDFEKAIVVATLFHTVLMIAGGYFAENIPVFIQWISYLSPFRYSYNGCVQLEFNRPITCFDGATLVDCVDRESVSGQRAVDYLKVKDSVSMCMGCLIAFIIIFRVLAYLALRYMPCNNGRM